MIVLGEVLESEGDTAGAQAQFDETLAIRQKVGEAELVAESQVELANLYIEEGHPDRAIAPLRSALAEFDKEKANPAASDAYSKLSRALLLTGKIEDARAAIDESLKISGPTSDPLLRLPASIQKALVDAASSPSAVSNAQQALRRVAAEAKRLGYYHFECEARLALAELQARTNTAQSRSQLAALATEARDRGFQLMAHRAEAVLSSSTNVLANNRSY
jgi:tetratricopeptide (TPR) repeat protein